MLLGGGLNPQEQSQLILVEKSIFMRRTNLTFGQNGDGVKPLTTNEMKPLSEDERRTLSHAKCLSLLVLGFTHQKGLSYHIFELEDSGLSQQGILPISARKTKTMDTDVCLKKDSPHCAKVWDRSENHEWCKRDQQFLTRWI